MELGFSPVDSALVLNGFLVFVFAVLTIGIGKLIFQAGDSRSVNLPPGPWRLPIIGNLHQLLGSGLLPHQTMRNLANKYGPVMYLQLGEHPTVVVTSAQAAKEVMQTHDLVFASRAENLASKIMTYDFSGFGLSPYGNQWRELRKICMIELFSKKRVLSFRSAREAEVSKLIGSIASKAGSAINLTETLLSLACDVTSKIAFGNNCKERELFISITKEFLSAAAGSNIADLFPSVKFLKFVGGIGSKLGRIHQHADRIISNIIEEHKQSRSGAGASDEDQREDLVDVLLKVQESGDVKFPITTKNIKAVLIEIFAGGIESSATVISWALSEMIRNPEILKKAQAEVREVFGREERGIDESCVDGLHFLKLVIKETLRLHPPAPLLFPREARASCKISGFDIPPKTRILINAGALARDPKYWTEPERFNPERFLDSSIDFQGMNFEYLPFGSGRRICVGIAFAMANIEFQLAMLLYHFDWKLPNGMKHQDLDMAEKFGMVIARKHDLLLIPTLHHPSPVA